MAGERRVGAMQRRLLGRALASATGWTPVAEPDFPGDKFRQYRAAKYLRTLGFIEVEKRRFDGRLRVCLRLTDLGRAYAKKYVRQIFLGGQTRPGAFLRDWNQQRAATAP